MAYDKDTTVGVIAALISAGTELAQLGAELAERQDKFLALASNNYTLLEAYSNLDCFPKDAELEEKLAIVDEAIAESGVGPDNPVAASLIDVLNGESAESASRKATNAFFH